MLNDFLCQIKRALYKGWLIPLIYGVCMAIVSFQHSLFSDFDGVMQYFSGEDIYRGNGYSGWASHFWPPLYALLTSSLSWWIDAAQAARLVSVVSASLLLWVAQRFVYLLSGNSVIACLAQLLIATNYIFVLLSIKTENHMLDSLFYVWTLLLLLQSLGTRTKTRYFMVGVMCGLAGLSRYTSYSLLPALLLTPFFFYPYRSAIGPGLRILGGFILVSSPWWVSNYLYNGSPVSSWQYMNIGAGISAARGGTWWSWWWSGIDSVHSLSDIILQMPGAYVANFFRNVIRSFYIIILKGQATGLVCLAALCFFMYRQHFRFKVPVLRDPFFLPILIAFACYVLLVSQAFVFDEVFLSWLVLMVVYGTFAIYRLNLGFLLFGRSWRPITLTVIALAAGVDVFYTKWQLSRYMNNAPGLEENRQIVEAIKAHDSNLDQKLVMSFHPARAYYLGSSFVMLPPYYQGDINGLVTYKGMSFKVRDHAPRFPSTVNVNDLKIDYLIYDKRAAGCLPQFAFLLDSNSNRIPSSFQLVYLSPNVAVYHINGQLVHQR